MTGMAPSWFQWVESNLRRSHDKIENLEKSLKAYKQAQKRMLYCFVIVVVVNGLILFLI